MEANLEAHKYKDGVRFYIVVCNKCRVVLNSGRHYSERDIQYAINLAHKHNSEQHGENF